MNIYRVEIEQWTRYGDRDVRHNHESLDVRGRTAQEAISKALTHARRDGYLKSRPIEVTRVERIAADVL